MKITKKRLIAYLIDLLILGLVLGLIMTFKEPDPKLSELSKQLNIINEAYAHREYDLAEYFDRFTFVNMQMDQERIIYTIFNIFFILSYFTILPYYWNGQTLGKKIMKIKIISSKKVSIKDYLIRNAVINGLGYMILTLSFLYLLSNEMYFVFISILSFIQLTLVIISISMVLYRRDKRGLHDILSGTKVIEEVNV